MATHFSIRKKRNSESIFTYMLVTETGPERQVRQLTPAELTDLELKIKAAKARTDWDE